MRYVNRDAVRADLRVDSVDQRVQFHAENLFEQEPNNDTGVVQLRLREGLVLNMEEVRIGDVWRLRFADPDLVVEHFDGTDWIIKQTFSA